MATYLGIEIPLEALGYLFYLHAFLNGKDVVIKIKLDSAQFEEAKTSGKLEKVTRFRSELQTQGKSILFYNNAEGNVINNIPLKLNPQSILPYLPTHYEDFNNLVVKKDCNGFDFLLQVAYQEKCELAINASITPEALHSADLQKLIDPSYSESYAALNLPGFNETLFLKKFATGDVSTEVRDDCSSALLGFTSF